MAAGDWKAQHASVHAPQHFCATRRSDLDRALDGILGNARLRYEGAKSTACARRDSRTCPRECNCRRCFTNFYYPESTVGPVKTACLAGPECSRFRELHTVVHTAAAATHIRLLLTDAMAQGFLAPAEVFTSPNAVAASYGCGGGADLVGCLSWASETYEQHSASSMQLRGCDVVEDWFEMGAEAVALAVGDYAPWTRGVYHGFSSVDRVPTDDDLAMFDDADVALFSWVLSIPEQEGILDDIWPRIVKHLRPGAVVVITDRWEPVRFNSRLRELVESTPSLESVWGVGDYCQVNCHYQFDEAVLAHGPRCNYGASGVVARVR